MACRSCYFLPRKESHIAGLKPIPPLTLRQSQRLWSKIDIRGLKECWPWLASTTRGGYGQFRVNGSYYVVTRVVYRDSYGTDPGDLFVCHECDNPPCCNPSHFFLGDGLANHGDKASKGRSLKGSNNPASKLVEEHALDIYESTIETRHLADKYGVSGTIVRGIRAGRLWRHIHATS